MQFSIYTVGVIAALVTAWYVYQIASRKTGRVKYKFRLIVIYLGVAFVAYGVLKSQRVQETTAGIMSILAGCGVAYLVTPAPKQTRRIPKAIRDAVIARDLGSKGLKWDPAVYHIDHKVPFSKGGDNSIRNLRVVEKHKNLSKGNKMPGVREFLR